MAQRIVTSLIDDFDGSAADKTIAFSFAGKAYSIDLNAQHVEEFEKALAPYVAAASKVGATPSRRAVRRSASRAPSATEIRDWAHREGLQVSARGRISADVRDRYLAAH